MKTVKYPGRWWPLVATMVMSVVVSAVARPVPALADTIQPAERITERASTVKAWQYGGPLVRQAAGQALLGSDTDIHTFVTSGWAERQAVDERVRATRMLSAGGTATKAATSKSLAVLSRAGFSGEDLATVAAAAARIPTRLE